MYLECRLRCQMVSAHGVWVKHQSAVPVLTQHTYWVTTTISRRTGTVINHILDINYCIAVLNKTVSQLIVKFHVQLVNHIVWLFYGGKFPFTLNIVDLPSSLLSIKTTNRLLGSKRHFGVSKWRLVVLDQYNRPGWGWELLSQPDGLMIVQMKKKQKKTYDWSIDSTGRLTASSEVVSAQRWHPIAAQFDLTSPLFWTLGRGC